MSDRKSGVKSRDNFTKLDLRDRMSGCIVRAVPTILELRESSGKSRAAVAADLSMSERHLYRLENGRPLRHLLILAFANYYGVKPEEIDPQEKAAA